jgi:glycogen phosphorylase
VPGTVVGTIRAQIRKPWAENQACDNVDDETPAHTRPASAAIAASTSLMNDPICGMPLNPEVALSVRREGRIYYFCSSLCREAFIHDPSRARSGSVTRTDANPGGRTIAYFSMEIALAPALPTYSGGLGVLAGDTLRSCADIGVPIVGVTLLYRHGYFVQTLDERGHQREGPASWRIGPPLRPLPHSVEVMVEERSVRVRGWVYDIVGAAGATVPVLLLDTEVDENDSRDRGLCNTLYGGDERYRLAQEIVLGVGGVRLLGAAGYGNIRRFHLNEGHAALAPLELVREANLSRPARDFRFDEVRGRCVFTTHTPVPAGHDHFAWPLVENTLGPLVPFDVLRMLGDHAGNLNMTALALNLSGFVNGVAQKHAELSRGMFPGYPIHHVTNGVHSVTWTSPPFRRLFDQRLPGWRLDPAMLRNAGRMSDDEIWAAHVEAKHAMLAAVETRTGRKLDPDAFVIGFARRATQYKRGDLVLSDLARLREISLRHGPLQMVFAGKAHPRDEPGKEIIRRIFAAARALGDQVPVVYLPEYDMELGALLTAGVDLWLNSPQRPLEASGTSGMKAAHNGVPSLSVLDGWWIEGHVEGVTGWSFGPFEPVTDLVRANGTDAGALYAKLETILPLFRDRTRWVAVMRQTIALNASHFNTHRMVQQYAINAYL